MSTTPMYDGANIGSGNSRNSPRVAFNQDQQQVPQQQAVQSTPLKQTSVSSLTTSSASSSTSDFGDLHGDLLADLWHSSTNESMVSNGVINVKQPIATYPVTSSIPQQQAYFPPQPQQQPQQQRLYNPGYTNWNTSNNSPPVFSTHQNLSQNTTMSQPTGSSSPSSMDPFDGLHYEPGLLPRLTEENLMIQENDSFTNIHNPVHDSEELFNFEHHPRFTRSTPMVNGNVHQHYHPREETQVKSNASVNTQLYKTELCASFMKMGICPYGNKCQFAHGENELKRVERPPKWRSKPCANWAKYGSCRYGNRCCFKHGD
ncbi:mRNA decay factor CTH1 [Spathaspora sp. JA1]|nr:mRNA decay factor CTH1 [Spathaspora sp. JA1]